MSQQTFHLRQSQSDSAGRTREGGELMWVTLCGRAAILAAKAGDWVLCEAGPSPPEMQPEMYIEPCMSPPS